MTNFAFKQKIIIIVAALAALLILIFQRGFYPKPAIAPIPEEAKNQENQVEPIKIVATNPSPLDESTILPTQVIEITFNYPLENTGEFKHKFEPEFKGYELKLSDDRKTVTITPTKAFKLGTTYTFSILPDSKFDGLPAGQAGKKVLKESFTYHFRTIEYRGV